MIRYDRRLGVSGSRHPLEFGVLLKYLPDGWLTSRHVPIDRQRCFGVVLILPKVVSHLQRYPATRITSTDPIDHGNDYHFLKFLLYI